MKTIICSRTRVLATVLAVGADLGTARRVHNGADFRTAPAAAFASQDESAWSRPIT